MADTIKIEDIEERVVLVGVSEQDGFFKFGGVVLRAIHDLVKIISHIPVPPRVLIGCLNI